MNTLSFIICALFVITCGTLMLIISGEANILTEETGNWNWNFHKLELVTDHELFVILFQVES